MSSPLIDRLRLCADLWTAANGATLARLGRTVINDGGFFTRIEASGSTTTATLEKFSRYLSDAANWPEGRVPEVVREFGHVVGGNRRSRVPATGLAGEMSGHQREAGV